MAPADASEGPLGPPPVEDPQTQRLLSLLPSAQRYEESWMHRGSPTVVCCHPSGASEFLLSGSDDGHVKLWRSTAMTHTKKKYKGTIAGDKVVMEAARQGLCLEFIKDFKAHGNGVKQIVMSADGFFAASLGVDETIVKVYNVRTFDLFAIRRLPFVPSSLLIVAKASPGDYWMIASEQESNQVCVFNLIKDPVKTITPSEGNFSDDEGVVVGTFGGAEHGSISRDDPLAVTPTAEPTGPLKRPAPEPAAPEPEGGLILMGDKKRQKTEADEAKALKEANLSTVPLAKPIWGFDRHNGPVHKMSYVASMNLIVSADRFGGLEVWPVSLFDEDTAPAPPVAWDSKMDTDLLELMKKKTYARAMTTSDREGGLIAVVGGDLVVRVFSIRTGKMLSAIDESIRSITMNQMEASGEQAWRKIDNFDFGRRVGCEKELMGEVAETPGPRSIKNFTKIDATETCQFDESGQFLLYSTLEGIKIVEWRSKIVRSIVGMGEQLRFTNFVLFQAPPITMRAAQKAQLKGRPAVQDNPYALDQRRMLLLACSGGKRRFFVFSHLEPSEESFVVGSAESRDHLNEAPTKEEREIGMQRAQEKLRLQFGSGYALLHTTKGDIKIQLNMEDTPKTIENFVTHSRNGYYNGLIFHRVIKGFMLQTGCPNGKGTGGESIWGGHFEDEIVPTLRHDRPYTVSMANAGPGTNGSQFFITTVPCMHLDGKHTVFGKVTEGHDVVHAIENVVVNREDRPYEDIKIVSIKIED